MEEIRELYDQQWKNSKEDIFSLAFTEAIAQSYSFLGELNGKKVLEIGCGSGEQAVHFAGEGASVTVIDISSESLNATFQLAQQKEIIVKTVLMNAEQLTFPKQSFDLVYINSTLMHVNQLKVFQECSKVLKIGGKLVVLEPLQFAPLVKMYRLFSSYRKMKPKYMTFKMFQNGQQYFSGYKHKEFYLFSSILLPFFSLRIPWLQKIYYSVSSIDNLLLKAFPWLKYGYWVCVSEYQK